MALLVIVGGLVNGPYALITTAVSAELGTHSSLKGNAKALSTVTSIIDGTGSIGKRIQISTLHYCSVSVILTLNTYKLFYFFFLFSVKLGAAVGPLVAAYVSDAFNWTSVFYILMGSNILAILVSLFRNSISYFYIKCISKMILFITRQ